MAERMGELVKREESDGRNGAKRRENDKKRSGSMKKKDKESKLRAGKGGIEKGDI